MKKTVLTGFVLFLLGTAAGFLIRPCFFPSSEKTRELDEHRVTYKDGIVLEKNKPFTGRLIAKQQDRLSVCPHENGKREGLCLTYQNNILTELSTWKDGKKEGLSQHYSEQGLLEKQSAYRNGILHGSQKLYFPDGTLKESGEYDLGRKTGIWKTYNPNGTRSSSETYKDGELNGTAMTYNSDGFPVSQACYINGKLSGRYTRFNRDWSVSHTGTYKDGKMDGIWEYYRYDGTLSLKELFRRDKKLYYEAYDQNGKLESPLERAFPETKEKYGKKQAPQTQENEITIKETK